MLVSQAVGSSDLAAFCYLLFLATVMPEAVVKVHPAGLDPWEFVKGYYKFTEGDMSLDQIVAEGEISNLFGNPAGRKAIYAAIVRVREMSPGELAPQTKYNNYGRKKALTESQEQAIVAFVKKMVAIFFARAITFVMGLALM